MHRHILFVTLVGLLLVGAGSLARAPGDFRAPIGRETSLQSDFSTWVNANKILMFVTNRGSFAYDNRVYLGKADGMYFPFTSMNDIYTGANTLTVMYASGLWIGGRVNGELRLALSGHGNEFGPGPMANGTFLPDDPSFRVYQLYQDSLAGNPNDDYQNWPVDQGAPVDLQGRPHCIGEQTLWTVFNDANPDYHHWSLGSTEPLGVEVQLTVWAMSQAAENQSVYMKYKLYNKGGNTVEDCYIGIWADPDIGNGGDDLVGCDSLDDLFFCYNDGDDANYGSRPPAVGFKIIDGPVVPSPGDTANFDGTPMPGFKNLGMVSFQKYRNPFGPQVAVESYMFLRGLDENGDPLFNGTMFQVSGDPVTGTGVLDTSSADKRMIGSCGPFTLLPGDSQYVFVKIAVGQGTNELNSITKLREILNYTQTLPPKLMTTIEPDPIIIIMTNALDPIQAVLTFGYDASAPRGSDINYGSLFVTDLPPIDSMVIAPAHPGFNGEVARFYFSLNELLIPYQPLWNSVVHSYWIGGQYVGSGLFRFDTDLTIYGHRLGDLNLDGRIEMVDLVFMVDYFFKYGPAPQVIETADLDENDTVNIIDMVLLVDYLFPPR